MHAASYCTLLRFQFTLGEFDPNIFPIPSAALNPHDRPQEKQIKCPEPVPATHTESTVSKPHASQNTEPTPADKDFFMALACLAARRSKDPHRQVHTELIVMQLCTVKTVV